MRCTQRHAGSGATRRSYTARSSRVYVFEAELVLGGPSHPDGRVEAVEVDPTTARDGADVAEGGAALAAPDRLRGSGGPPAGHPPDQSSHAAGCVRVKHVSGSPHP